ALQRWAEISFWVPGDFSNVDATEDQIGPAEGWIAFFNFLLVDQHNGRTAGSKCSSHPRIDLEIHLRVYWLGPNILSKPLPQFSHKAECKLCGCRELFSIVTCP